MGIDSAIKGRFAKRKVTVPANCQLSLPVEFSLMTKLKIRTKTQRDSQYERLWNRFYEHSTEVLVRLLITQSPAPIADGYSYSGNRTVSGNRKTDYVQKLIMHLLRIVNISPKGWIESPLNSPTLKNSFVLVDAVPASLSTASPFQSVAVSRHYLEAKVRVLVCEL